MHQIIKNTANDYDPISKLFHWTIALLIIGLISLGLYMTSISNDPGRAWYFNLHKSLGIIAGILILLRILWRSKHKPHPLPKSVPLWQAKLARFIHLLLYVCMVGMPLTGFIGASFGKHGISFFGWPLPVWTAKNSFIAEQLFETHEIIAWILIGLIVLHVLAAFKHLLWNKDGVFQRMWFGFFRST